MRKVLPSQVIVAIVAQIVLFVNSAGAIAVPEVLNDTYVYDGAGVISDTVEVELNDKLRSLEKDTSAEIFVVTLDGLDGEAIEDAGYEIANGMRIGQAEHDNGLLVLVSPPEGRQNMRIEVGKGMEGIFNDAKVGRILDATLVPARESGDYEAGIVGAVDELVTETRDNAEWVGVAVESRETTEALTFLIGFAVVGVFVVVLVVASAHSAGRREMVRKGNSGGFWAAVVLGMALMNRGRGRGPWGGRGGFGGFGGSSGGGGFGGGFSGGGSFGGGGASR